MKLRIRGDSIRLRLRQPELGALIERGLVEETTSFSPSHQLKYALMLAGEAIQATFDAGQIVVTIPKPLARQWANTQQVGVSAEQPIGGGRSLHILIEKDFACKEGNSDEPQDDAFENPAGRSKC